MVFWRESAASVIVKLKKFRMEMGKINGFQITNKIKKLSKNFGNLSLERTSEMENYFRWDLSLVLAAVLMQIWESQSPKMNVSKVKRSERVLNPLDIKDDQMPWSSNITRCHQSHVARGGSPWGGKPARLPRVYCRRTFLVFIFFLNVSHDVVCVSVTHLLLF